MKKIYLEALNKLLNIVKEGNEILSNNYGNFEKSLNSLIHLGDEKQGMYNLMVETNEYRAAKVIESLAVQLFLETGNEIFSFYPIDPAFKSVLPEEQIKSRPFQIILTQNCEKHGVVFSVISDIRDYVQQFNTGKFAVKKLKIVVIANPNKIVKESEFTLVNNYNREHNIPIERIPVLDFWKQYFGTEECNELLEFCNKYNEKAKELIGFNTVVAPTPIALQKFKKKCGDTIISHNYTANIPDTVYSNQIEILEKNYLHRGLWKAMIGKCDFSISFLTSEWFYTMYQLTENLDLTNIIAGYLKSIEQLLFAILHLSEGSGITIKSKRKTIVQFSAENADIIDTTLWSLKQVIKYNSQLLDVNETTQEYLISTIDDWREKQRNGYFHKNNLHSIEKIEEIRECALQLYFLILGSCSIRDDQLEQLGIEF